VRRHIDDAEAARRRAQEQANADDDDRFYTEVQRQHDAEDRRLNETDRAREQRRRWGI
jgi:hypothetical protein